MSVEIYCFQPLLTNSGRVYLSLLEKGVDFIERELNPVVFEHLQEPYLKVNPKGQVPALVHDGRVLTEGMTINEYIDEAFEGPPLRPADPGDRWRMRCWCRFVELDLGRAIMMINWNRIIPRVWGTRDPDEIKNIIDKVPDPDRQRSWRSAYLQKTPPEQIEESWRRSQAGVRRIEHALTQSPWLAGQTYSLADIDHFNFFFLMERLIPDVIGSLINAETPATRNWLARMEERPAVKEMRARTKLPG